MSADIEGVQSDEQHPADVSSDDSQHIDPDSEDLVRDLVIAHNDLQDRITEVEEELDEKNEKIADLEQENTKQEAVINALRTQNKEFKRVLAGSVQEFGSWTPEDMVPMHARLLNVEDDVEEHEDKLRMMVVDDGKKGSPDERAAHLRQVLYNEAKTIYKQSNHDGEVEAKLARDHCSSALGSTEQRATVLDAMKRAADGEKASDPDHVDYSPIQGSSSLEPMDAITFNTGASVNGSGEAEQSHIKIRLDSLTLTDLRKNLTTVSDGMGDSA